MAEIRRRRGDGDSSDLLNDEKEAIAKDERNDSATAESSDHVNIDFYLRFFVKYFFRVFRIFVQNMCIGFVCLAL